MAKNEDTKELVRTTAPAVPSFIQEQIGDVAGMGNSMSASDNTMPFLAILQSNSPQLEENKPEFIPDARKGMLFNTATKEIYDGKTGVLAIPFAFQKALVEWGANRSGYVAQYHWDDKIRSTAKPKIDEKTGKQRGLILPNGNDLTETAYTFLLFPDQPMPIILGATSTAWKPMRDWMVMRNNVLIGGKVAPSFAKKYLLQTVFQENESGSWYNWKISAGDWVSEEQWARAFEFAKLADAGEMVVGRPPEPDSPAPGAGDDGIPV